MAMNDQEWKAEKERLLREAQAKMEIETDPEKKRSLLGTVSNYKRQLTMGRDKTRESSRKSRATFNSRQTA